MEGFRNYREHAPLPRGRLKYLIRSRRVMGKGRNGVLKSCLLSQLIFRVGEIEMSRTVYGERMRRSFSGRNNIYTINYSYYS